MCLCHMLYAISNILHAISYFHFPYPQSTSISEFMSKLPNATVDLLHCVRVTPAIVVGQDCFCKKFL